MKNRRSIEFLISLQIFFIICSRSTTAQSSMEGVSIDAVTHPLTLSEGPHWDSENQVLYFVDIPDQRLYCWDPATGILTNTYIKNGQVGVAVPVAGKKNTFVAGAGRDFVQVIWDPKTNSSDPEIKVLTSIDTDRNDTRFNDGKIDPHGRFWGGTMALDGSDGKGSLYRIGSDYVAHKEISPVSISNGLTWSHDKTTFYYIDSPTKLVVAYDYNDKSGDISNRRVIFDFTKNNVPGIPDGMTIDITGNLWVACYGGKRVINVDPRTGKLLRTVNMPADEVTSVAFGGPNLSTLFVTTARQELTKEQLELQPLAGSVFAVTGLGVNGDLMRAYKM